MTPRESITGFWPLARDAVTIAATQNVETVTFDRIEHPYGFLIAAIALLLMFLAGCAGERLNGRLPPLTNSAPDWSANRSFLLTIDRRKGVLNGTTKL
jgi:hypothetical protein